MISLNDFFKDPIHQEADGQHGLETQGKECYYHGQGKHFKMRILLR